MLEYYLRNNITAPYVLYGSCQLLLQNTTKIKLNERYRLFDVKSVNKEGENGINIGKFEISLMMPRRCGDSSSKQFVKDMEWVVYWQDYGEHILNKVAEWGYSNWCPVGSQSQLKIACWELLTYIHDYNFSELPISLLELNYQILDTTLPIESRLNYIDRCIQYVAMYADASDNPVYNYIVKAWSDLSGMVNSSKYAHWLVKLTKGEPCWN